MLDFMVMMRRPEKLSSDCRNFFIISSRGEIVEGDSWDRLVLGDAETGLNDMGTVGDSDNGKVASS